MQDGQPGGTGSDGEVLADRFIAMAPTIVARWTRQGRTFRVVAALPIHDRHVAKPGESHEDGTEP